MLLGDVAMSLLLLNLRPSSVKERSSNMKTSEKHLLAQGPQAEENFY